MTSFTQTVRVVGAGLLGTSIGLALTKQGVAVVLASQSAKSVELAVQYGAGKIAKDSDSPDLIVVCVPPNLTAKIISQELEQFPNAIVTDVASVKASVLKELIALGAPINRYVGSHPMAGRERGGVIAGRADLFVGRPWVITPNEKSKPEGVALVKQLAIALEASVIETTAVDHDRAVALVSHVPQLISSLLASRLVDANANDVSFAGQGLRDTTRIAASDPALWMQILQANSKEVQAVLQAYQVELDGVVAALSNVADAANYEIIEAVLKAGNIGIEKIPGKHGTKHSNYAQVIVMIDDKPGELARLLTEVGEIGINLEELKLEHSPSAQIGLVELYVLPAAEQSLIADLQTRGWRIA